MKVEVTAGIQWFKQHQAPGTILDLSVIDATWLINRGKAIPVNEDEPMIDRSVGLESSTVSAPKRRTKKKVVKKAD